MPWNPVTPRLPLLALACFAALASACGARSQMLLDGEEPSPGSGVTDASTGSGGAFSTGALGSGGAAGSGGSAPLGHCDALVVDGEPVTILGSASASATHPTWVRGSPGAADAMLVTGADGALRWTRVVAPWSTWPPAIASGFVEGVGAASHAVGYAGDGTFSLLFVDDGGAVAFAPVVSPLGIPQVFDVFPEIAGAPASLARFVRPIGDRTAIGYQLDPAWPTESHLLEFAALSPPLALPPGDFYVTSQVACDDVAITGDAAATAGGGWLLARSAPLGVCTDALPPLSAALIQTTWFNHDGVEHLGFGGEVAVTGPVTDLELAGRVSDDRHWLVWRLASGAIWTDLLDPHAETGGIPMAVVGPERGTLSIATDGIFDQLLISWLEVPAGIAPNVVAAAADEGGTWLEVTVAENRPAMGPISIVADSASRSALVAWQELTPDGSNGVTIARLRCVTPR